jgi:F0F1-type ATP synthase membrane subunit a
MYRKKQLKKAHPKLQAFVEMVTEDINDALDHKLHPGELTVALLMLSAAVGIQNANIDADEYMGYAAEAWNDRVSRLEEEEEEDECPLPFQEDIEEPKN